MMELMIALSLTVIVLGIIFSSLYQNATLKSNLEKGEEVVMTRARIQERLDQVFANVDRFYTDKEKVLHFKYDNGIDPNPLFSGLISGMIIVEKGDLYLALIGEDEERKTLLRKGVSSLNYLFLYLDENKIEEVSSWDKKFTDSPFYLKMILDINGEKENYSFWVNHENSGISLL